MCGGRLGQWGTNIGWLVAGWLALPPACRVVGPGRRRRVSVAPGGSGGAFLYAGGMSPPGEMVKTGGKDRLGAVCVIVGR